MVRANYAAAYPDTEARDIFSWVSYAAVARACVLGLTSEGWSGHEIFNVVAPGICWEGGVESQFTGTGALPVEKVGTLELVRRYWPEVQVEEGYWKEDARRAVWDCSKARRVLGWWHE
jgi:nucleoside-diphosphate-sugar epimerase